MSSFQQNNYEICKEKYGPTQEQKQSIETTLKKDQMLYLQNRDFKSPIVNMFIAQKEDISTNQRKV